MAAVAIAAGIAHLAWSSGVAFALERFYPHRVVDLRRWSGSGSADAAQRELLARFIDVEVAGAERPVIAFFGSSFLFGYPWQERVIATRRFSELRPDRKVINASVIGATLSRVHDWELCGAMRQHARLAAAVIEIPVVNTIGVLADPHREDASGTEPNGLSNCAGSPVRGGYLPFAVKQPLGLGWLRFVWDVEAYEKPDAQITLAKVPPGYFVSREDFARVAPVYRAQIEKTLGAARDFADRVYAFPSPVYLPGLTEIGEDRSTLSAQLQATLDACRAVPGVECLDVEPFYEQRESYYNLTHLNQRGHDALARWLAEHIDP